MFTTPLPDPELIAEGGRLLWRFPDGRTVPVVRGGDDPDPDEKKFTQADLDRIVQERVARAKSEPPADYEDLKKAKQELDKMKADAATDAASKLTADEATAKRIADLEAAVAKSTADIAAANTAALAEKRRSAIVAAAATQKALNPHQVAALLDLEQKHKDAVTIGDDGQVTGAESAVKAFIEANPHFVGTPPATTPASRHQGGGDASKKFGADGKAEAAKRFGPPGEQPKQ